jgi:hypothetical protein
MSSLRIFGSEKIVFERESESGLHVVPYFLGKNISQTINIILGPIIFISVFSFIIAPRGF